jgi:hypothetical protein
MGNLKHKRQAKRAELRRYPFFTPEHWRSLFGSLFKGEDKREDADLFARYALLLSEALDQGGRQVVKTCLKSAMVAAKESDNYFGTVIPY